MNDNFSVLIVEDEQPARELLINYILKRGELKLEGIAANGEEALNRLSEKKYDIVFIDVALPVMSGIEVLEKIDYSPYIIFTTAFDEYAIRAFEIGAIDYLLKPFTYERFSTAIDKALVNLRNRPVNAAPVLPPGLSFKENGKHCVISFDEIIYLSSCSRHTVIHAADRRFETSHLLKELCGKLPQDTFARIHKRYCVNLKYVLKYGYFSGGMYEVVLRDKDNTVLPVGKNYAFLFKEKLTI